MTAPNVHRAMPGVSLLEVFFTDSMGLAVSRGPDWMPHERSVPALKAGLSILRLCDPWPPRAIVPWDPAAFMTMNNFVPTGMKFNKM